MDELDTREWILTNGLGSFASGTVCDARTRTYHGWLIAALNPPVQRTLLLSHLEASLEVDQQIFGLGTNFWADGAVSPTGYQFLQAFRIDPIPTWVWQQSTWQLTRELLMPFGLSQPINHGRDPDAAWAQADPQFSHRLLIRYRYTGQSPAILRLRLLIGDRSLHQQHRVSSDLRFAQGISARQVKLQAIKPDSVGVPWCLRWTEGQYQADEIWYWRYHYPEEAQRGLSYREDLYSPGYLILSLQPDSLVVLEAQVGWPLSDQNLNALEFDQALQQKQQRFQQCLGAVLSPQSFTALPDNDLASSLQQRPDLAQQLLQASDHFVVYRASVKGPSLIAGYPWFSDWGRPALMALPGLTLATQRFRLARDLLTTFSQDAEPGLLPNVFPEDGTPPIYNSIDAALWWIEALGLYLEATQDWEFLVEQYSLVQKIYKALTVGTRYNIGVDAADGLLTWDAPDLALTWMDAFVGGQPLIPRRGKPIEVNALWYSALCWAKQWADRLQHLPNSDSNPSNLPNQARRYSQHAQQVAASLQQFWNAEQGYLYDTLTPDDHCDASIRPNAILALSLHHCAFPSDQAQFILAVARDRLLTPYGCRSLDPGNPAYIGHYSGNLFHRDRAYYQGTVWPWLVGPFTRAWQRFCPDRPLPVQWDALLHHLECQAGLGAISELFDGEPPHTAHGAMAQLLPIAELLRCWLSAE